MQIEVNGISIHYETAGQGRPLLLLHGNGETHAIFDKAVPLLAERFTVYALDTRGHGQSSPVSEYHYADMAEDVRCFLSALSLERPALYGFSDGGIVGLLLASAYPQLLSQLVVSGANTSPEGLKRGWLRFFALLNRFARDEKIAMMLREPHLTAQMLACIEIPVLALAGSRDMVRRQDTEFIAASVQKGVARILPGESHGSYVVHSEKIARLLLAALPDSDAV